jgi:hypothetical protein
LPIERAFPEYSPNITDNPIYLAEFRSAVGKNGARLIQIYWIWSIGAACIGIGEQGSHASTVGAAQKDPPASYQADACRIHCASETWPIFLQSKSQLVPPFQCPRRRQVRIVLG